MTPMDSQNDSQGSSSRCDCPADSASVPVVRLPSGYRLTEADRLAVLDGQKLFICGSAVAKAQLLTHLMRSSEIAWYWIADERRTELITDVLLPVEQDVSYGSVKIPPEAVVLANREARRDRMRIVGAGHSHHHMGAWTSRTDEELMDQLSAEGVGYSSTVRTSVKGQLQRRDSPRRGPAGQTWLDATFPAWPHVEATIIGPPNLNPADLHVQLTMCQPRLFSLFSTSDTQGRYHFPQLCVTRCSLCGSRLEQEIIHPATICVIGPVAMTTWERNRFLAEFERRAPRRFVWCHAASSRPDALAADPVPAATTMMSVPPPDEFEEKTLGPAPFSVYRRGELIGEVDAKVLEEAAWTVPALAKALRWIDDAQPESQAEAASDALPKVAPPADAAADPEVPGKGEEA